MKLVGILKIRIENGFPVIRRANSENGTVILIMLLIGKIMGLKSSSVNLQDLKILTIIFERESVGG